MAKRKPYGALSWSEQWRRMTRQARSRLSSGPDCDSLRPAYVWLFVVLLLFCDWLFSIVYTRGLCFLAFFWLSVLFSSLLGMPMFYCYTPEDCASPLSSGFMFPPSLLGRPLSIVCYTCGVCLPALSGSPLFDIFWVSIVVTCYLLHPRIVLPCFSSGFLFPSTFLGRAFYYCLYASGICFPALHPTARRTHPLHQSPCPKETQSKRRR